MLLNCQGVVKILENITYCMMEQADYLSDLDAITGDAEHGINMKKGFSEVQRLLPEFQNQTIAEVFKRTAKAIMTATGGSAGVLYGTAFLAAAKAVEGCEALDVKAVSHLLRAALDAMMHRGGAQPGDKTMIDTLYPAVLAFEAAAEGGGTLLQCSAACTQAARQGMEHTKELVARKGRASYQGENSKGHQDPGATSLYYMLEQADAYVQQQAAAQ